MTTPNVIFNEFLHYEKSSDTYIYRHLYLYISKNFKFSFIEDGLTKKIQIYGATEVQFDFTKDSFLSFLKNFPPKWKRVETRIRHEEFIDGGLRIYKTLDGIFLTNTSTMEGGIKITLENVKTFIRMKRLLIKAARTSLNKR